MDYCLIFKIFIISVILLFAIDEYSVKNIYLNQYKYMINILKSIVLLSVFMFFILFNKLTINENNFEKCILKNSVGSYCS